jgi:hypothetical protein
MLESSGFSVFEYRMDARSIPSHLGRRRVARGIWSARESEVSSGWSAVVSRVGGTADEDPTSIRGRCAVPRVAVGAVDLPGKKRLFDAIGTTRSGA